jgi:hypothetical protein
VTRCQAKFFVGWAFLGTSAAIGKKADIKAIKLGIFTSNGTMYGGT